MLINKIASFTFLAVLLISKVDASQASSTSSASNSCAQSQTSALLESLFASLRRDITREFGLTNNTTSANTIAQKAKERSPLEKIEETIKLANGYKQQGNQTLAIKFMKHAYDHSFDFPFYHSQAAGNLGMMFFGQGDHAQALAYLEEAHTLSKKLLHADNIVSTCLAVFLGRIYLLDRGVKPNYAKAFAFLTEAQESADGGLSAFAKNFIGLIYLEGLGKRQNTLKARSYLLEALKGSKTPEASDYVLTSLLVTLSKQLKELDTLLTSIVEQQQRSSSQQIACMIKQAYTDLEEIKITQKVFPFYLTAIFSKKIAEKEKQLNQLQSQIEQEQKQKSSNQASAQITASIADVQTGSKTLEVQTTQATMQGMLKEAIERYEAFLKKPTDARYQEAVYALHETLPLVLDDTKTRTDLMQRLDHIIEVYKQQKKTTRSVTAKTQEKKDGTKKLWSLFDPFHQIIKPSAAVQQRLNLLQTDYLEVPNVIKLHGFINLWRTRVGVIRIIYTVLPEFHAIGIVQIDDRKDVYENVEELEHREAWFHAPNLEARLQERADKKA